MAPRMNIDGITPNTLDWTCKVQIVDMSRPRLSLEKKTRFQNLILEDEQVKVSVPSYGRIIHKFYWVLDKEALIEHVEPDNQLEKPLLPPTNLHTATFASIANMNPTPNAEIDIIGVVLRCGPSKYAGRTQNRCREVTIANDQRNQFLLTLWDDFGEIEGTELEAQMENGKEFPIILGRNIGVSGYQGLSLQTRFNSTIHINPTYPQALQLISWAKTNKNVLSGNVSANFAGSSTTVIMNPVHRQVISIAEIKSAASVGVFCIEPEIKQFDCAKCQRKTTLVPRCTFQIDLIDGSGSTTAFISGDHAEKLLSMKAEDIFYTTCVKNQLLCVDQTQQMLSNRLFYIQLRKSSWISSPVTQSSLTILSYTEKEHVSLPSSSERGIKRAKSLDANEVEMKATFVESESSSNAISIEPPTPIKKL
ncbi:hypothetical protein KY284_033125 [Solanum tuberosum]|nr:hypothetical protein KY284_033125 [Solanum tuberosum]